LLAAITHQIYSVSIGDFHGSEALMHIPMELFGATLGGSLLLLTIGWVRNQKVVEKTASKPEA
jgi:hypothetical protein